MSVSAQAPALFSLRPDSGIVLEGNDAAQALCAIPGGQLAGRSVQDLLGADRAASLCLRHALMMGQRVTLPTFVVRNADGLEVLVNGILQPQPGAASELELSTVLCEAQLQAWSDAADTDVIAVLGVDQLRFDQDWGARETTALLADIQASLAEIIRARDVIILSSVAAVALVLREVEMEQAQDISRALLSHLHGALDRAGDATADLRYCVGLAPLADSAGPLSTLVAANNALLQAQSGGLSQQPIHVADDDGALAAARAYTAGGVLGPGLAIRNIAGQVSDSGDAPDTGREPPAPLITPMETDIEGYVVDNMEGAVDQAIFMSGLDVPVAIIGPAGTGKMYVARIIHEESGGEDGALKPVDCREFRSRNSAADAISRELARGAGRTLVFKSPQLMHAEVQVKLARQLMTRTRTDVSPPRYLPPLKLIALFPDSLESLLRKGELTEQLASAFAGYPIRVPAIKDRKQAVLRWAHKILGQEGASRERDMKGFTPDAERAMLLYDWPGNISEMRQVICDALEKTDKDWLTPVDLGLFKGLSPDGTPFLAEPKAFLDLVEDEGKEETYVPSSLEAVDVALGEAVHNALEAKMHKPLGAWLEDDLVLAAMERYRGDLPRAATFLHTRPRNISRWLGKIEEREEERNVSSLWQHPRRLLREWVRESGQLEESPLLLMQERLMSHVNEQAGDLSAAKRARIMGVSTPTFLKRVRELELDDNA